MKPLHYKLAREVIQHTTNERPMVSYWFYQRPHFEGTAPHRFETRMSDLIETKSKELCCVYCGCPKTFFATMKESAA